MSGGGCGNAGGARAFWLEVAVVVEPGLAAELASAALFQAGATGIEERGPAADGRVELIAYLPADRVPLDAAPLAAVGAAVRSSRAVADEDWEAGFWKGLAPVELGRRLVVLSTRAGGDAPAGRAAIRLDPGSAFGTGLHPSTALAAGLLEEAIDARAHVRGKLLDPDASRSAAHDVSSSSAGPPSVLDVGTGSGILAIAAYALGARPVLAIDNAPEAVAEAWSNARRNGCRDAFEASDRPIAEIGAHFDIVVANLDAPTFAGLAPTLADRVAPGGELIVSGLREAEACAVAPGMQRVETRSDAGWRAERWRKS